MDRQSFGSTNQVGWFFAYPPSTANDEEPFFCVT